MFIVCDSPQISSDAEEQVVEMPKKIFFPGAQKEVINQRSEAIYVIDRVCRQQEY